MSKYICISIGKEDRALYYSKDLGRRRIYRSSYPFPDFKQFKLFKYKKKENAQKLCDSINERTGDVFEVMRVEED